MTAGLTQISPAIAHHLTRTLPVSDVLRETALLPTDPGVYSLWLPAKLQLAEACEYEAFHSSRPVHVGEEELAYVGATRQAGLRQRLLDHLRGGDGTSTMNATLRASAAAALDISDVKRIRQVTRFWLRKEALVAFAITEDPLSLEGDILRTCFPLLNIGPQRYRPYARHLLWMRDRQISAERAFDAQQRSRRFTRSGDRQNWRSQQSLSIG